MSTTPVLWHLEISHFNEKARWALDYKSVPHIRKAVFPGLQEFRTRRLGAGPTTPVLVIDGRAIGESSVILEEIERRWPEPPLFPSDPDERRRALEIQARFDELGHDLRRVVFSDLGVGSDAFLDTMYGPDHPRKGLLKRLSPVLSPAVRARFSIKPERVEHSRRLVLEAFDWIASEIGPNGYLVGDSFSVADLTAAAIMTPLLQPPQFPHIKLPPEGRPPAAREFRDSCAEHPGGRWVFEMYERHRSPSAAVEPAAA